MKLAVTDIRLSAFNTLCATIDVEVEHGKSIYSVCSMNVSVPLVDGRAVKDHEEDLKSKAREIITGMYKEIVCGGETNEASGLLDYLSAKTEPSKFSCEVKLAIKRGATDKDLEERVALLEKHLENTGAHTPGVNQESDDSLVVRDADGSVRVRMNAEQQTGLKVTVSDKNDVLWMRDSATLEGIMSLGYLKDGTQQRIIAALEDALFQAKSQLLLSRADEHFGKNDADMLAPIGSRTERRYTEKEIVKIFSISADLLSGWVRYRN